MTKTAKINWEILKDAVEQAIGGAWYIKDINDSRYLTICDADTLKVIQVCHIDGRTMVNGRTMTLRRAAAELAEMLHQAYRFGALGDFTALAALRK